MGKQWQSISGCVNVHCEHHRHHCGSNFRRLSRRLMSPLPSVAAAAAATLVDSIQLFAVAAAAAATAAVVLCSFAPV